MSKLVIVGTVAFDAIETPFGKTDKILGGAATYIGFSAANFDNVDAAAVSVVGGDFPQEYLDLLTDRNVNIDGIEIVKDGKTFFWSGRYHNDMNSRDTLATELNVLETFTPVVPKDYQNADIVMLGNLHPLTQQSVLDQMSKKPKLAILDTMNFWMDIALDDLLSVIKNVDVITINDEEARQLTGEYSLVVAARKIHEMGPKYVVIKKGEHGALLFHYDNVFYAPALPLEEVFDPTGAGDIFATAFLIRYFETNDIPLSTNYANAAASFCIEKKGTEGIVSHKDIINRTYKIKEG